MVKIPQLIPIKFLISLKKYLPFQKIFAFFSTLSKQSFTKCVCSCPFKGYHNSLAGSNSAVCLFIVCWREKEENLAGKNMEVKLWGKNPLNFTACVSNQPELNYGKLADSIVVANQTLSTWPQFIVLTSCHPEVGIMTSGKSESPGMTKCWGSALILTNELRIWGSNGFQTTQRINIFLNET